MAGRKYTREACFLLLREKYALLREMGLVRYPQRSDFSDAEVVAIKAFLGPWPRALEAAGIKPPREKKPKTGREKSVAWDSEAAEPFPVHTDPNGVCK